MKTYVLTVSRVFPCTHKRKGEETNFPQKLLNGILKQSLIGNSDLIPIIPIPENSFKIHTIRANKKGTAFENWSKKVKQIQKGEAILSIRYWSGKPYNSKQVEICQLDNDSGIGVQQIWFSNSVDFPRVRCENKSILALMPNNLAKNDGLSLEDFKEWFNGYDLSKPMAIIHFTKFRY